MFSRFFAALTLVACLFMAQVSLNAAAAASSQPTPVQAETEKGPMTSRGDKTWQILSMPLRLMTGATGLAFGAIGGGIHGIVRTEEEFAQETFGAADQNPLMVPVGLVGTIAAVPVGIAKGVPSGAARGGTYGYHLWDKF